MDSLKVKVKTGTVDSCLGNVTRTGNVGYAIKSVGSYDFTSRQTNMAGLYHK